MIKDEFDLIEMGNSEKQHFLTHKDIELLENYLMQLILFDDSALTNIALRALLRLMKPQSELISTLTDVQLLSDKASVKLYNDIDKEQEKLKDMSKDGKIDDDEIKAVKNIFKKWSRSCVVGDTGKANEKKSSNFQKSQCS